MFREKIEIFLNKYSPKINECTADILIDIIVSRKEAIRLKNGTLASWTPSLSTGRSPKDTLTVRFDSIENSIDWSSPNNIPLSVDTYEMIFKDALEVLSNKTHLFMTRRIIGSDFSFSLPVITITDRALTALFTYNMFRDWDKNIKDSLFFDKPFYLLVLPYDYLDEKKYRGRLRTLNDGNTSKMAVVIDYANNIGIVFGSSYCGSVKKLMFTVMNYLLPDKGILPLHCSANEDIKTKSTAIFLGLSGTGKTTLSTDPERLLIGDDEHAWGDNGIVNFENGCYAKLINLNPEKEPDIYQACFDYRENNQVIIENVMVYPDGNFDLSDDRLTPNSRGSYPLKYLKNVKLDSIGRHPSAIIFLTADANGVLPPIVKLDFNSAMLWFFMGYTSKLAGTETGIIEPVSTFSRFFGGPFMPRNPMDYMNLLKEKIKKYNTQVYLINTGWSGGPYGLGKRMDISLTRAVVKSAVEGRLQDVKYVRNNLFKFDIPLKCPDVPDDILFPENTWKDKEEYKKRAYKLAMEFSDYIDKASKDVAFLPEVIKACPGK